MSFYVLVVGGIVFRMFTLLGTCSILFHLMFIMFLVFVCYTNMTKVSHAQTILAGCHGNFKYRDLFENNRNV